MIFTYQLGPASLSVDGVSADQLGEVIATVIELGRGYAAPDHGGIELTARQREQLADLQSGTDPLDDDTGPLVDTGPLDPVFDVVGFLTEHNRNLFETATNGEKSQDRQHLELVDLDDDDALPRIAFDAYVIAEGGSYPAWEKAETQEAWRAAAAAVKTAALLQQANRAVADA